MKEKGVLTYAGGVAADKDRGLRETAEIEVVRSATGLLLTKVGSTRVSAMTPEEGLDRERVKEQEVAGWSSAQEVLMTVRVLEEAGR